MVAVPFLGLLAAVIETGLVFLNGTGLEAGVQDAARNIMTGEAQGANTTNATTFLTNYLCTSAGRILPANMNCSDMIVDVRTAASFAAADTSSAFYTSGYARQFCMGAPGDIVIVRVAYPMPVFLPIIAGWSTIAPVRGGLVNDVPNKPGWYHLLVGTAVFQNEPYPAANYTKPSTCS